jgi:phage tail-like protein
MPITNPVPNFRFQVFLFDAESSPSSVTDLGAATLSIGVGVASSVIIGGFAEVNGLTAENEIEEYREGGWNFASRRFTKSGKYPLLTLRRGISFAPDLWDWHYQVLLGKGRPKRRNGIVILNDPGGKPLGNPAGINIPLSETTPAAVWFLTNGIPQKLDASQLKGTGNEIAIETLEIAHEGLFRVGTAQIPSMADAATRIGL